MRYRVLGLLCTVILIFGHVHRTIAQEGHCACQNCQDPSGCCYHDVVKYRCVQVPDKKQIKKTVYECKEVPYCVHRLPKFGHCDCCPECEACPRFKKVLVKHDVVVSEFCTTKCVVEEYCERVLGPCCKCGYAPTPVQDAEKEAMLQSPPAPIPAAEPKSAWLPPEPPQIPVFKR